MNISKNNLNFWSLLQYILKLLFLNSVFMFGKKATLITCSQHRKPSLIWNGVNVSVSVCLLLRNKVKLFTLWNKFYLVSPNPIRNYPNQTASNDFTSTPTSLRTCLQVYLFSVSEIPGVSSTTDVSVMHDRLRWGSPIKTIQRGIMNEPRAEIHNKSDVRVCVCVCACF